MIPAILGGVSDLVGGFLNRTSQKKQNERNYQFTQEQNRINREWQEQMWNKTNAYNSPAQQMARFKEAGLNPHLIYGQGNPGNATMASQPTQQTPRVEREDYPNPFTGGFKALQTYISNRKIQAETSNLETTNRAIETGINKTNSEIAQVLANTAKTKQETQQAGDIFQYTVQKAKADATNTTMLADKIKADIANTLASTKESQTRSNVNLKQLDALSANIASTMAQAKLYQLQGQTSLLDQEIKRLEINLLEKGINRNDPVWFRIGAQLLDYLGGQTGSIKQFLNEKIDIPKIPKKYR